MASLAFRFLSLLVPKWASGAHKGRAGPGDRLEGNSPASTESKKGGRNIVTEAYGACASGAEQLVSSREAQLPEVLPQRTCRCAGKCGYTMNPS
ncbi:hypothetical protein NDU88_000833 [Pleurodeles waltl]|uniref:Secreted protein n=1 Tax=Pleurodeles waltl TaxID=8319 RepID=A0AAV7P2F9_PLEWA|nr:hypothetical protein NDU88_000833 [Pleurodeles waltl]